MVVTLGGSFGIASVGSFATLTTQGLTLTAVTMGSAGNSITIAFTPGATAGAEVVTVSGNAISVQIQTGVSTVTQVRTALNASITAAALVTTTGTNASTVATASALNLATGADTQFNVTDSQGNASTAGVASGFTLSQTGTGIYKIQLDDRFRTLLGADIMLASISAVNLVPQLGSVNTTATGIIMFRFMTTGTETNAPSGTAIRITLRLRNN